MSYMILSTLSNEEAERLIEQFENEEERQEGTSR